MTLNQERILHSNTCRVNKVDYSMIMQVLVFHEMG